MTGTANVGYNAGTINQITFDPLPTARPAPAVAWLTLQFMNAAGERQLPIVPWTINDPADLKRLIDLSVAGINTRYPDRLLGLLP